MDFRYLTESKNEFNNFLCNIMIPHLYNGISGMLDYSIQTYNLLEEKRKKNKKDLIHTFKKIVIVWKMKTKQNYNIQCLKTCKFACYKSTRIFSRIIFS